MRRYGEFVREYRAYKKLNTRFRMTWHDRYPCLRDKTKTTEFSQHYIYHTAWAARVIAQIRPEYCVDISSSLYFTAIVSAFVPVRFYDFRPAELALSNVECRAADLLKLPFDDNSIGTLSCLHVAEHVGLGRYGDAIDEEGDLKAIAELKRVVAPGGNLLFVVPLGKPKIIFNADRVYAYRQILEYFEGFELREFALIGDAGEFLINAPEKECDEQNYGCGCFWFIKKNGA
jgi:SAM-dependent methyltransferase